MRPSILTILLVLPVLSLISCGTPGNPSDPLGDFPTSTSVMIIENTGEARIRYILADIQLSGLYDYYLGYPGDAEAVEAIQRWDQGIRVVNIDQFERKVVGGNWKIVYTGTETVINGMDVILSEVGCNHPYWPIRLGARWSYDLLNMMGNKEGEETWEITDVSTSVGETRFSKYTTSPYGNGEVQYVCNSLGIFSESGGLVLPPSGEIVPGNSWPYPPDLTLQMIGYETVSVPAGSFYAARFSPITMYASNYYWAEGVGMVQFCTELCKVLASYYIPSP
jgi:hypothetical protein